MYKKQKKPFKVALGFLDNAVVIEQYKIESPFMFVLCNFCTTISVFY